jgi:hypothetical protein
MFKESDFPFTDLKDYMHPICFQTRYLVCSNERDVDQWVVGMRSKLTWPRVMSIFLRYVSTLRLLDLDCVLLPNMTSNILPPSYPVQISSYFTSSHRCSRSFVQLLPVICGSVFQMSSLHNHSLQQLFAFSWSPFVLQDQPVSGNLRASKMRFPVHLRRVSLGICQPKFAVICFNGFGFYRNFNLMVVFLLYSSRCFILCHS